MRKQVVLLLAFSAAIFFPGLGKTFAQSRSASIELSAPGYGSGSGSFEYNPTTRQFAFSGSFFGYTGYGFGSFSRSSDNSIAVGAFTLYTTYANLTVPAFSMGRSDTSYFGSFNSTLLGQTVSVVIDDMNDSDLDGIPDISDGTNNAPVPIITSQPQSASIALGGNPILSVTATSRAGDSFFYQWKKNGSDLQGENDSTLSFSGVTQADAGRYSVYIQNDYGNVTSSTVTLTVVVPPAFAVQTTIPLRGSLGSAFRYAPAVTGSAANFTASNLPPGLTINRTTGVITGTPSSAGYFSSTITASNIAGTATLSFTFTIPGSLLSIPFSDNFSAVVANRYLPFNIYSPASLSVKNGVASFDSPADGENGATAGFVLNLPLPLSSSWDIAADVNLPNGWETTEAEIGLSLEPMFGPSDTVETHSIRGNYLSLMLNRDTEPSEEGANNIRRNAYVGDVEQDDLKEVLVDDSFVTARLRLVYLSGNKTLTAWVQTDPNSGWVRFGSPLDLNPGNADSLAKRWSLSSGASLMLVLYGFAEGGTGGRTISLDNLSITTPVAPVITSTGNLNGQVGIPFSYQISAANRPISYGASNLPAGLEVNTATGLIRGTPSSAGVTSTVVLSAVNPAGTGTRTNTAVILPAFTSASSAIGFVNDSAFTHPVTVGTHSFGSNLKYAASGLPTGMTINATSGVISGKPTVAGAFPAMVTITANGVSASQRVDFRIQGAAGGAFSLTLNPRPTNVLNLPMGLSYSKTTGVISGTSKGWGDFTATGQMSNGTTTSIDIPVMPSVPVIGGPTNWNGQVGQEARYQIVAGGFGREWAGSDDFSSSSPNVNLWKLSHGSPAISVSQNYRQTNGYATFFSTKTSGESSGMIFWKQPLPTWQSWRILMAARFAPSSFRVSGGGSVEGLIGVLPNVNSPRSKFAMNLAVDSDSLYAVPNWGVNSSSPGATDGEIRDDHGLANTVLFLDYDAGQKTIAGSYLDSAEPSEVIPAYTLSTTNWQGLNQFVLVMGGYSENATIPLETLQMDNFLCLPDPNDLEYRAYLVGTNGAALTNGMGERYLPEGLYCDSQTGTIQGQLEEGVVGGIYRVWVQAEYKTNNLPVQDMPLIKGGKTVVLSLLPAFTGASSVTGFVNDSAFTHPVTVGTHSFGSNLKYAASGLPTGMTINTTSGVISGKPTVAGAFPATVTITANGVSASQRVDFRIQGAAGGAFSLTLNPRPTNVLNLPAGLIYNKSTGVISGTPQVWGDFTATGQMSGGTTTSIDIPVMPSVPVIGGPTNWNTQVGQETRYQIVAGGFGREWAGWDDFNGSSPSTNWLSSGPLAAFRTNGTTKSGLANYQGRLSLTHGGTTNQVGSGYLVWARTIPVGARWVAMVESGISTNLNLVRRTNNLGQATNGQWISTKMNLLRAGSEVAEGTRLTAELDRSPEEGNILLARINGGDGELGKLSAPGDSAALALRYDAFGTIYSEGFPEQQATWQTLHSLSVGDMGLTSSNQWRLAVGGFSEYFRIEQPGLVWWDNFVLLPDPGVLMYRAYLVDSNGAALTDLDGNPYLPEGLDLFDNTAGAISGIPSDSLVGGTYRIRVEAEYNPPLLPIQGLPTVKGGKTVLLTLLPAFTGASSATGFLNVAGFTYQVGVGTHSFGSNLKFSAAGLPTGTTINATSGLISGKPTAAGTFGTRVTITAGTATAFQDIQISVYNGEGNRWAVGGPVSYQVNLGAGVTGYQASGLPTGMTINAVTGLISGTPTAVGEYSVTVTVPSRGLSTVIPFFIRPIYVNAVASGANNGSSWANAYRGLQAAIDVAGAGSQIWVAAGTYKPTSYLDPKVTNDPRSRSFVLKGGVTVLGGFAGTETQLGQRDVESNPTVLSGDFNGNDSAAWPPDSSRNENAYHVIVALTQATPIVLDGLTITGGNASNSTFKQPNNGSVIPAGVKPHEVGGGGIVLDTNFYLRNCEIQYNCAKEHGGMLVYNNSVPKVFNFGAFDTSFINNLATYGDGGAINIGASSASTGQHMIANFKRCVFEGNEARCGPDEDPPYNRYPDGGNGAAIHGDTVSILISSCAFINNYANGNGQYDYMTPGQAGPQGEGGAIFARDNSALRIVNSIFAKNLCDREGGAIAVEVGVTIEINFCTFYKNSNSSLTGWGGAAIGGWYNPTRGDRANSLSGFGNIFWENQGLAGEIAMSAESYTPAPSRLTGTVTTTGYLYNNTGTIVAGNPQFADTAQPAGADGMWFTADDGLKIGAGSPALGIVTSARPTDFADLDEDGNTTELLPYDAAGVPFNPIPNYNAGAYQTLSLEPTEPVSPEPTEKWSLLGSMADNANWGRQISNYAGSIYSLSENGGNFVKYDLTTKIFSNLARPPYSTWGSVYKWLNGKYYLIGGYNSSKTLSYDPNTNLWTILADAPRQGFFQAVALNGKIYLIGGSPGGLVDFYSQCSVFDPSSGWGALPSLPAARNGAAIISEGNDICVIGGYATSSSLPSNTVYKFNTRTSSWSTLPSMLTSRSYAQAISDNGNIYIIGGYPQSDESAQVGFNPSPFEKYQISDGSRTSLPSLQYSGSALYEGITILNGSIYMLQNGQRFDLAKNQWFSLLPSPADSFGIQITVSEKIYLVSYHATTLSVYEYTP